MHRRGASRRTPKFKPEVKPVANPSRQAPSMPHKIEKIEVLPEPIKSDADKKLYKTIRLENGLTALLISDPSHVAESESSDEDSATSSGSEGSSEDSDSGLSQHSNYSDDVLPPRRIDFNEEKMAACSLTVGVGSFSDPPEVQGLAHFVEHMLFMGSEKYPKENEFDAFIKKKGGSDNAATDCEMTTFYFEIPEKHLHQAMDMFSQFFVSPLMLKEAMQRERESIESEFAMALPSDSNRKDQLLASTFPAGHPARTFTWGNMKSLRDDINDDDRLQRAALQFMKRHYSAHRMTVAVQARMDLQTLEDYVINTFSRIPTNNLPPDNFQPFAFDYSKLTKEFKSLYYVKSASDTNEVHVTWCYKSLIKHYESKPHQYISFILGHEGKGSLLSYLRKRVWALGITTGVSESGIDYTSMYSLFSVNIVLTQSGLEHVEEVVEALYAYMKMLRHNGPLFRFFEELQTVEETNFRFAEEMQPADYVETLSENMQYYPPQHYIAGDKLFFDYDAVAISEMVEYMMPDLGNVMILSSRRDPNIQYDQKEKWFGTEYTVTELPRMWLGRWLLAEPYPEFHLPDDNIYIATNFDLVTPAQPYFDTARELGVDLFTATAKDLYKKMADVPPKTAVLGHERLAVTVNDFRIDQPNLLRKNRQMELWYKPDFKFRFPTALLYFYFITPLSLKSPREACLLDLWLDVVNQQLKEDTYPAQMAELSQSLYNADKGFILRVNGYNDNLYLLVDLVARSMCSAAESVSEHMLEAIREERARIYYNKVLKPHKLAKDLRLGILMDPYISPRLRGPALNNLTLADFREYSRVLLKQLYVQMFVQGNLAWYEAIEIADKLQRTIKWEPVPEEDMPVIKVHQIPRGQKKIRVMSMNQESPNSMVTNYYQAESSSVSDTAVLEVIMISCVLYPDPFYIQTVKRTMFPRRNLRCIRVPNTRYLWTLLTRGTIEMQMEEPLFDTLRTKEQLGYSVYNVLRYTYGVLGFSVSVNTQANKYSVAHVDRRVEKFLRRLTASLHRLADKELRAAKLALVHAKHTADLELREEAERHWKEIVNQDYNFQRLFIEAEAIEKVTHSDLRRWLDKHFPGGKKKPVFRKLSVQVVGHNPNATVAMPEPPAERPEEQFTLVFFNGNELPNVGDEAEDLEEFVTDIQQFRTSLPVIPTDRVQLPDC